MAKIILGVLVTVSVMAACTETTESQKHKDVPVSNSNDSSVVLDLSLLLESARMPHETEVKINYDHFFKTAKTYRAYSLQSLLSPYLQKLNLDGNSQSDAVVTFICSDGYKPSLKLRKLLSAQGYIAFCNVDTSEPDQCWPDSINSNFQPYYLVWQNIPYNDETLPWPYGLQKIKIDKADTLYDAIFPFDDTAAIVGFNQFRNHCIKCHSINKIGGNVGPDFNYPKNITSYWEVENMWKYAKNPQSFRYNAHMNPITSLTREEFDEIVVYLWYIRSVNPLKEGSL